MPLAELLRQNDIDSFYTLDTEVITRRAMMFTDHFPGRVLFAVKSNPLPAALEAVIKGGVYGFDIASIREARSVLEYSASHPSYYMNPAKNRRDIEESYKKLGIRSFVVDSITELNKMCDVLPADDSDIQLFVRFSTEKSNAIFDLGLKFGATLQETQEIGREILARTNWRAGLAFHVGSQTTDVQAYIQALAQAEALINDGATNFSAVDIGGGFPGVYLNSFGADLSETLNLISHAIDSSTGLRKSTIYCEPGRSLVCESMSLFCRVNLRKGSMIYLSQGVYGGLLSAQSWFKFPTTTWRGDGIVSGQSSEFTIFGPTCDSLDKLHFSYELPSSIGEGDWVEFKNVGAYSISLRTDFNGFRTDNVLLKSDSTIFVAA